MLHGALVSMSGPTMRGKDTHKRTGEKNVYLGSLRSKYVMLPEITEKEEEGGEGGGGRRMERRGGREEGERRGGGGRGGGREGRGGK